MSNPVFNIRNTEETVLDGEPMTVNGTLQAAIFLGLLMVAAAGFVWSRFTLGYNDFATMLMSVGGFAGFFLALIVIFARKTELVPIYAICEGLFLGGISAMMEAKYPGIVVQAIGGTMAAYFSMLLLYRTGIIKCTERFRSTVLISTASVAVIYLVNFIGSFFGYHVPLINSASIYGIAISLLIIAIAALNLIIDFDFIERGEQMMLPKKYEWYGAFGLLVTIVWLYIEILKLFAKLQRR